MRRNNIKRAQIFSKNMTQNVTFSGDCMFWDIEFQ